MWTEDFSGNPGFRGSPDVNRTPPPTLSKFGTTENTE